MPGHGGTQKNNNPYVCTSLGGIAPGLDGVLGQALVVGKKKTQKKENNVRGREKPKNKKKKKVERSLCKGQEGTKKTTSLYVCAVAGGIAPGLVVGEWRTDPPKKKKICNNPKP